MYFKGEGQNHQGCALAISSYCLCYNWPRCMYIISPESYKADLSISIDYIFIWDWMSGHWCSRLLVTTHLPSLDHVLLIFLRQCGSTQGLSIATSCLYIRCSFVISSIWNRHFGPSSSIHSRWVAYEEVVWKYHNIFIVILALVIVWLSWQCAGTSIGSAFDMVDL